MEDDECELEVLYEQTVSPLPHILQHHLLQDLQSCKHPIPLDYRRFKKYIKKRLSFTYSEDTVSAVYLRLKSKQEECDVQSVTILEGSDSDDVIVNDKCCSIGESTEKSGVQGNIKNVLGSMIIKKVINRKQDRGHKKRVRKREEGIAEESSEDDRGKNKYGNEKNTRLLATSLEKSKQFNISNVCVKSVELRPSNQSSCSNGPGSRKAPGKSQLRSEKGKKWKQMETDREEQCMKLRNDIDDTVLQTGRHKLSQECRVELTDCVPLKNKSPKKTTDWKRKSKHDAMMQSLQEELKKANDDLEREELKIIHSVLLDKLVNTPLAKKT